LVNCRAKLEKWNSGMMDKWNNGKVMERKEENLASKVSF
jgi:hypothetical protein